MSKTVEDENGRNSSGEDEDNQEISEAVEKRRSLKRILLSDSDDRLAFESLLLIDSFSCVFSIFYEICL